MGVLMSALIGLPLLLLAGTIPKTYPLVENPIEPPDPNAPLGGGLAGFESPYVGHTGSWDGKGGAMFGFSKRADLDKEVEMGLHWTFMCVYWRAMEPSGPVDLSKSLPPAWKQLDAFVAAAHERELNILMQAPVVGGNAGGPPKWAGRRKPGKSAPVDMDALADFAGKLARRYCPGGILAKEQEWGQDYGVRAWEIDNEPESYRTNWGGQAADYAEFVTKARARIKAVDPQAVIITPGVACGDYSVDWLEAALDAKGMRGSLAFREQGEPYSLGPATDVVSFHIYEGLNTFLAGKDATVGRAFQRIRGVFEEWETHSLGFEYARKKDYWHTEGNFDFLGLLSEQRRAAWRFQFFTRAFAAGVRKVVVMDASPPERVAVRTYVDALPNPFPMMPAETELDVVEGKATAFRHPDGADSDAGQVWVVWALADTGGAVVTLPVRRETVEVLAVDGSRETIEVVDGRVRLELKGDSKMPPPVLVVDRPACAP